MVYATYFDRLKYYVTPIRSVKPGSKKGYEDRFEENRKKKEKGIMNWKNHTECERQMIKIYRWSIQCMVLIFYKNL